MISGKILTNATLVMSLILRQLYSQTMYILSAIQNWKQELKDLSALMITTFKH